MNSSAFERLVREAVRDLPKRFRERLANVDVVVEEGDEDGDLGLYEGVPLSERGQDYSLVLPDKITLYRRAIEAECRETGADVRDEIRDTIRHEIAHHFGMTDDELEEGGIY